MTVAGAASLNGVVSANGGYGGWGGGSGGSVNLTSATLSGAGTVRANAGPNGNDVPSGGGGTIGGTIENSIIYNNISPTGPNYSGGSFEYSCTTLDPSGINDVTSTPLFVDTNAFYFTLLPSSPCIDTGTNQAWMIGSVDLADADRIVRGVMGSKLPEIVDMGAYEFPTPLPTGTVIMIQ